MVVEDNSGYLHHSSSFMSTSTHMYKKMVIIKLPISLFPSCLRMSRGSTMGCALCRAVKFSLFNSKIVLLKRAAWDFSSDFDLHVFELIYVKRL